MFTAGMVVNHIHNHFHPFGVGICNKLGVKRIISIARVNLIMVGNRIAVIGSALLVIFLYRCHQIAVAPNCLI